jgi:hypothetical protein
MQDAFFVLALSFRGHDRPQIFVEEPTIVSTSSATNNTYIVRAPWGSLRIVRLLSEVDRTAARGRGSTADRMPHGCIGSAVGHTV